MLDYITNNMDKLDSIREQLKNNVDIYGNPLVEITLELSEDELADLESYLADFGLTLNELIWLYFEGVINNEKPRENR